MSKPPPEPEAPADPVILRRRARRLARALLAAYEGIERAKAAEHGFRHTATMHSKHLDHLSRMARVMDVSIFVKNAPALAGLGHGVEGFCSFTIASPTGEGLTGPTSFSRIRRCVLVDHFRIV